MKKAWIFCIALVANYVSANHIVGGEIEFITLSPGSYRINIIQYFDQAQSVNQGPEGSATVYIFSNRTNEVVSSHLLLLQSESPVFYTNPNCSISSLQTSRVLWSSDIILDPTDYADPEGYYIEWERCCRNGTVSNIVNPLGTGMKYITEIPPLWKNGAPYINSSPVLFQPLSDYACVNQIYYVEFTGNDPDGDSLVYSLANPLNSSAQVALPIPQPKPHQLVRFKDGFSVQNMINGSLPLNISQQGLLTVRPAEQGLFVFSVLVEEYRNGKRIGTVQRDFQMLVIDGCKPPDPPEVAVKIPGRPDFQTESEILEYDLADDKCFEFIVKNVAFGETISLRAEGVNFEGDLEDVFSLNQILVGEQDSLIVEFCAPRCPPLRGQSFIVDLIAGDDACPLPQLDTVRLTMEVEPPRNEFPIVSPDDLTRFVNEGDLFIQRITAVDRDLDEMTMEMILPAAVDPTTVGFSLEVTDSRSGVTHADFIWDTSCDRNSFGNIQNFPVRILIDDKDECDLVNPDLLELNLNIVLPFNTNPVVSIPNERENFIIISPESSITFDVNLSDEDNDEVSLRLAGDGFNPAAILASMPTVSGSGEVNSTFTWEADCDFLSAESDNEFTFFFIGDDQDKCQVSNFDTLAYTVKVELPENLKPEIERQPVYQLEVNEPFEMELSAMDPDFEDFVTLSFFSGVRRPNSPSLSFETVSGQGEVSSTLFWQPECSLLDDSKSRFYDIAFIAFDDRCPVSKFDTTKVTFEIVETRKRFDGFFPPNVFTPNKDNLNDEFRLSGFDDPSLNLPIDNCGDEFEYISIHNRTGENTYYSEQRDFSWTGDDLPTGIYFYVVKYTKTEYKNYVQLLR